MAVADALSPTHQLQRLFDDYWENLLQESPTYATFVGDPRYNDRLEDLSTEAIMRRRAQTREFLGRLDSIDASALPEGDRVSGAVLHFVLRTSVRGFDLLGEVPPELDPWEASPFLLSQMTGPQFELPLVMASTRFATAKDYDNYLKRLDAVPTYIEQLTQRLVTAIESGWVPPRITLRNLGSQFDAIADPNPARNPMAVPFRTYPRDFSDSTKASLTQAGHAMIRDRVAIAFAGLKNFVEERFIPATGDEIAASKLPGGMEYYATALQVNTSTAMSPQEIHDIGLSEVARIESALQSVQDQVGFQGSRDEFVQYLRSDAKFFCDSPQAILAAFRDIAKRIDAQLPALFRELPRLPYGIRAMLPEEGDNAEHYIPGAADGSRAGYFEANTNNLRRLARWQMANVLLHETVPGHHLQIARAQELVDLPMFRREIILNAYVEGWALYAEVLGDMVGMYENPLDKYGQLSAELFRAARLVVDTGIRALGWSRQQAIQYMRDHSTESEAMIASEIDRYIVLPGQATAYKIGQLRIQALYDKAKAALVEHFDLRAFHNALIDNGAMPLDVLDEVIGRWIVAQKSTQ